MQIILLSGGSGKRLWPLSNNARSKQFIKLLSTPDGEGRESMVQRVVRQLRDANIGSNITVATSESQREVLQNQLGDDISVVTEPERRDTFPAIALASAYLAFRKGCQRSEPVIVMPCDPFTEPGYFNAIARMEKAVADRASQLVLMGIRPTYPSAKYGYIVPSKVRLEPSVYAVDRFTEKPDVATAERLIAEGAFWNGGVFAFELGFMLDILSRYTSSTDFDHIRGNYHSLPKISFDYEVAEKAHSVAMVPFDGSWKDLGTWNTLTDELSDEAIGNVIMDGTSVNTHVINELDIPIMCMGTDGLVVAASPDGILISEKSKSENIKSFADSLHRRPMYEERRWGEYKVIDYTDFDSGIRSLTKQIKVKAGGEFRCHAHKERHETWTVIDGSGTAFVDGNEIQLSRGVSLTFAPGVEHGLKADTALTFIEVQTGERIDEV